MAEIIQNKSESELKAPEGDFKEWTQKTSASGKTFYTRDVDDKGNTSTKPEDGGDHDVDSHGPAFNNEPCYWPANTEGTTSQDFANKTGITWYKLQNTVGFTYQLTINTNATYNYTFNTAPDSYGLDVWQTWTTHEVTYTTFEPTVTSVSGR
ncbi:hypothetical protein CERZMDRAFT_108798 [Cercospora zeae-maydis SCOH1-5]|uniref:Uncharacterized protein n=1 Tax=Cercospora zeae-maydis SCOH1-5 TaxID=717836 RepID=A0A6A6FTZ3_9PEZI|nr:hypothetical protein CERZMDRAFT_108798 [Cercospora zeae-maydis SCOH1-5]